MPENTYRSGSSTGELCVFLFLLNSTTAHEFVSHTESEQVHARMHKKRIRVNRIALRDRDAFFVVVAVPKTCFSIGHRCGYLNLYTIYIYIGTRAANKHAFVEHFVCTSAGLRIKCSPSINIITQIRVLNAPTTRESNQYAHVVRRFDAN